MLIALLLLLLAAPLPAQRAGSAWRVGSSPMLELWSHGVALATSDATRPLPLYADVARDASGQWTGLARAMQPLRAPIARDRAFDVLHFAALPIAAEDPLPALHALVAPGGGGVAVDRTRGALAAALPLRDQQVTLAAFLRALEAGWIDGAAAAWGRALPDRAARLAQLDSAWRAEFVPALAPWLAAIGARGGVILVQPALGAEGRVLDDAQGRWIVGVADGPGARPLLAAVRELCFPLVNRVLPRDADVARAATLQERAAVRCGAMIVARALPARLGTYQSLYGTASAAQLAARYPLPPQVERALDAAIARAAASPAAHP